MWGKILKRRRRRQYGEKKREKTCKQKKGKKIKK
jgi:hypothetical protein